MQDEYLQTLWGYCILGNGGFLSPWRGGPMKSPLQRVRSSPLINLKLSYFPKLTNNSAREGDPSPQKQVVPGRREQLNNKSQYSQCFVYALVSICEYEHYGLLEYVQMPFNFISTFKGKRQSGKLTGKDTRGAQGNENSFLFVNYAVSISP